MKRRLPVLWLLLPVLLLGGLHAAGAPPATLAFLSMDNMGMDPRYDYLEGIIRAVLLFDLSGQEDVRVVNRADLESILREQELQMSTLAEEQNTAIEVGRVLGADFLLRGEYVFLGQDVLVTVRLLEVATARTLTFSERGSTENMLHALAEQIVSRLSGRDVVLQSEEHERSILSLKDESPGAIALHSNLIDAEIYLDGEFVGYTTGDFRVPFEMGNLSPGPHHVRIHLQHFGVVKEPEITFHDWEEEIDVEPGKRHVVRSQVTHFNTILYDLRRLLWEDIRLRDIPDGGAARNEWDVSFVDREGLSVPVSLSTAVRKEGARIEVTAELTYQGGAQAFVLKSEDDEKAMVQEIGKVELEIELDRDEVSFRVSRTDIRQNMFY